MSSAFSLLYRVAVDILLALLPVQLLRNADASLCAAHQTGGDISPRQFRHPDFLLQLSATLRAWCGPQSTETIGLHHPAIQPPPNLMIGNSV